MANVISNVHPDIALGTIGNKTSWLSNGSGVFTQSALSIRPQYTQAIGAADSNGDGRADLFTASLTGDHILWSETVDVTVASYCASFGLRGNNLLPGSDPDLDGVLNWQEMSFNLDPGVPDKR